MTPPELVTVVGGACAVPVAGVVGSYMGLERTFNFQWSPTKGVMRPTFNFQWGLRFAPQWVLKGPGSYGGWRDGRAAPGTKKGVATRRFAFLVSLGRQAFGHWSFKQ